MNFKLPGLSALAKSLTEDQDKKLRGSYEHLLFTDCIEKFTSKTGFKSSEITVVEEDIDSNLYHMFDELMTHSRNTDSEFFEYEILPDNKEDDDETVSCSIEYYTIKNIMTHPCTKTYSFFNINHFLYTFFKLSFNPTKFLCSIF